MKPQWHIGDVVRKLRKHKGIAAGSMGKDRGAVERWERVGTGADESTIAAVSAALGFTQAQLEAMVPAPQDVQAPLKSRPDGVDSPIGRGDAEEVSHMAEYPETVRFFGAVVSAWNSLETDDERREFGLRCPSLAEEIHRRKNE